MAYFAFYGLKGGVINAGETRIYPASKNPWGEDIVGSHMRDFKADALISLWDIWVVGEAFAGRAYPWIPWTPIDQDPAPPKVVERAKQAYKVLTYSQYGTEKLRDAGVDAVYIPHGVAVDVFHPGDKREAREKAGLPQEAFVVGMIAANKGYPSRKAFPENLLAFKAFREKHPEAVLYLHTLETISSGGIDFRALMDNLGLPRDSVIFCDQYFYTLGFPEEYMADAYRSMDVLLAASMGEGFGLPILEAQACGTPVITTRATSMPELTWAGYCVEPACKFWTPLNAWAVLPSVDGIIEALEKVYDWDEDERARVTTRAVGYAQDYSWDAVVDRYWRPFLEELEGELKGSGAVHHG